MRVYKILSFSVVILLITVLFAGVVTVPAAAQYDTMQFRYNAAHTGDYSPVAGLVPSNGQLLWKYTTGGHIKSSPAVVNGVVYVGSNDGNIYAISANTGSKLWNFTTGTTELPSPGGSQSPAVSNGMVYAGNYHSNNLYAISASTGKQVWNYTTGGAVTSSPTVSNGVVYVGGEDHNVYAIYGNNGTKLWNYTTEAYVVDSPAYANGVVYVGGGWDFYAITATTGAKLWNFTIGCCMFSSPAVANGVVYQTSPYGKLYAFNANDGTELWNYTTGDWESSPAVVNGVVYVGSNDNNVYALNATTGTKLWNYTTGDKVLSSPAYANGVVYVGSLDGNVYALNAATGKLIWSYTTGGPIESSPAVVNGVVYVGSDDGNLYAIGNQTARTPTALTLIASTTTPAVNQRVTFTATLNSGGTPLSSKSVTIYHYLNGVRYDDTTATTNANGQITLTQSFGSAAHRPYYATFAGDSSYQASTSSVVNVNVGQTQLTLTASNTNPAVNQQVTFTATLNSGTTPLSSKSVTIYHYFNGVRYTDTTATTNANGQITLTQSFGSAAARPYYATFAGDSSYQASTSSVVNVNVGSGGQPTQLSLAASNTNPAVGQPVTFTATLTNGEAPVSSKPVTIYHYFNGVRYTDTTKTTDANGQITLTQSFGSAAARPYYATFAGDSSYQASTSSVVNVNVGSGGQPTQLSLAASTTAPAVGQPVTFTATLTSGGAPLSSKSVTIYHYLNNVRYTDTTATTDANGQITLTQSFGSAAHRPYYATFAGDTSFTASTSGVLMITVH